jgi:hypothetical protein
LSARAQQLREGALAARGAVLFIVLCFAPGSAGSPPRRSLPRSIARTSEQRCAIGTSCADPRAEFAARFVRAASGNSGPSRASSCGTPCRAAHACGSPATS